MEQEQFTITLSDSIEDMWRLGFNGMRKDNELKGVEITIHPNSGNTINAQVALFNNTQLAKQTPIMQLANWSIINAYTNSFDYSNGANMWDGTDQAVFSGSNTKRRGTYRGRRYELHTNTMSWNISDEHYKIWKNNVGSSFKAPQRKAAPNNFGNYKNKGKMILKSTAVYGQTIFWYDTSKPEPKDK